MNLRQLPYVAPPETRAPAMRAWPTEGAGNEHSTALSQRRNELVRLESVGSKSLRTINKIKRKRFKDDDLQK